MRVRLNSTPGSSCAPFSTAQLAKAKASGCQSHFDLPPIAITGYRKRKRGRLIAIFMCCRWPFSETERLESASAIGHISLSPADGCHSRRRIVGSGRELINLCALAISKA